MSSWTSYPSIFSMGHRAIKDLLTVDINCEEKVDGSQFSFGVVETNLDDSGRPVDTIYCTNGETGVDYSLKIRSKGCVMHVDAPEKMFNLAGETVRRLAPILHQNWTYRGEYLAKPHHNALTYERVPSGNIIIFDINTGNQEYLSYEEKAAEAARLGLEVVPLLHSGKLDSIEQFRAFMGTISVLGGQAIEGVVIKPRDYNLYGTDKKVLMGKFVSEAFKEVHRKTWGENNPTSNDIIAQVVSMYATPARWNKALIHLREAGMLVDDVQDIGLIIREVPPDVLKECEDELKEYMFKWAWPHIRRGLTRGLPEWYKELLLKRSFEFGTEPPSELGATGERHATNDPKGTSGDSDLPAYLHFKG